jgi:hypothetical protein
MVLADELEVREEMGGEKAYVVVDIPEDFLRCYDEVCHLPYCLHAFHQLSTLRGNRAGTSV